MRLVLDEQQEQLRETARELLADRSPITVSRGVVDSGGYSVATWQGLADLGALGLVVPAEFGGAGAGQVERAVVAEELGRVIAPVPFLASAVLATDVLLATGDAGAAGDYLPRMVEGDLVGTVAVAETVDGGWDLGGGTTTAVATDDGWQVSGTKTVVMHGMDAGLILVYAGTAEGPGWFAMDADAAGLTRTPLATADGTRGVATITLCHTPARRLQGASGQDIARAVRDRAAVALGAEQLGLLGRTLELTTEYAKLRVQFGREVGSFQAVKFGLADLYCRWELASSVVRHAAWAADHANDELPTAAALVQDFVTPAGFDAAAAMIQYHGGIGYTWEHDAHLYYKRALSAKGLLGRPGDNRARLAELLSV